MNGNWHPGWIILLLIPVYYCIGGAPMDCAKAACARVVRPNKTIPQMRGQLKVCLLYTSICKSAQCLKAARKAKRIDRAFSVTVC